MIRFFEDILNQRPIKVILSNGVTLIALGVITLIGQWKLTEVWIKLLQLL